MWCAVLTPKYKMLYQALFFFHDVWHKVHVSPWRGYPDMIQISQFPETISGSLKLYVCYFLSSCSYICFARAAKYMLLPDHQIKSSMTSSMQ